MTDSTQLLTEALRLLATLEDLMTTADILGDAVGYHRHRDAVHNAKIRYARRHRRYINERQQT